MNAVDFAMMGEFTLGVLGVAALAWASFCYANLSSDVREIRDALRERERARTPNTSARASDAPRREVVYPYQYEELNQ